MQQAIQSPINTVFAQGLLASKMWSEGCPVGLDRLAQVKFSYFDFDSQEHDDGEIVVLDCVANRVAKIFKELHARRFPIAKAHCVQHYGGSDDLSMADNNTSSFNFRVIEGTTNTSIHSYGLAIDVNPLQNPFIIFDEAKGTANIHPPQGWQNLNRHNRKPGMVEEIVPLFAENGFWVWGGRWTTPVDYHHFQTPRGMAELLAQLNPTDGERFFEMCIGHRDRLAVMPHGTDLRPVIDLYREKPDRFFGDIIHTLASNSTQPVYMPAASGFPY
jgi:hypothetical protein